MYEKYTRQALPPRDYRLLLGTALCVFNSNNAFMIENVLRNNNTIDWYELVDKTSGALKAYIEKTFPFKDDRIGELFSEIVSMRDRIVHSYQITNQNGEQSLATKTKIKDGNVQFEITEEYLMDFIRKNEKLSTLLHKYRGY